MLLIYALSLTCEAQDAQLEALHVVTLLFAHLGKTMKDYAPELAQRVWQLLSGAPRLHKLHLARKCARCASKTRWCDVY